MRPCERPCSRRSIPTKHNNYAGFITFRGVYLRLTRPTNTRNTAMSRTPIVENGSNEARSIFGGVRVFFFERNVHFIVFFSSRRLSNFVEMPRECISRRPCPYLATSAISEWHYVMHTSYVPIVLIVLSKRVIFAFSKFGTAEVLKNAHRHHKKCHENLNFDLSV